MSSLLSMRTSTQSVLEEEEYSRPASASCDCSPQSPSALSLRSPLGRRAEEEEVRAQVSAMLRRERSPDLRPRDYLGLLSSRRSPRRQREIDGMAVDKSCRTKMVRWMMSVVDFCEFDRECASVAAAHLDRFLSSESPASRRASLDKRTYQLAAVSSLYLAIKTVESRTVLSPDAVADISDGEYSEDEVVRMESDILQALGWRVHGPTAMEFASYLLAVSNYPGALDSHQDESLMEVIRYQVELSTLDYKSSLFRPSVVAVAALCNALECDGESSLDTAESFVQSLTDVFGEESISLKQVKCVRDRLVKMVKKAIEGPEGSVPIRSTKSSASESTEKPKISTTGELSPVCVSSHFNEERGQSCQ